MRAALLTFCSLLFVNAHAQQWNWAADAGGGGNVDFCHDIATDSQGNAYWVGTVSGDVDFGCATLSTGNSDILGFLAKRAPDGTCVWVRGITVGFDEVWAYGIAIDHGDRIYVTGRYNGTASFGDGITLSSLGSDDIFLARYDTGGVCHWARRAGGSGSSDEARSVDVSADGGVFLTGYSGGTAITFDAMTIPNTGNFRQIVVARYDSLGTVQWAKASTGNGQGKSARAISVAGDRLFVTGQVGFSAATFDGVPITPGAQGSYLYVLAIDLEGNVDWARSYGSGDHEGMGISADTLGSVFVAGRMWGDLSLPNDTLTSVSSNDDILVMKLDRDGDLHWARSTGSSQRDLSWSVAADGMGNAYFSAQFNQSIDYFGTPITALGGEDILISKLDGEGEVVWAARPSGFQRDIPLCIHRRASAPHEFYFGGYFWGAITYGSTTIDDVQNGDAMIVAGVDTTFDVSMYATPICPGDCDGVAYAFAHGTGPMTYVWDTGADTPGIAGLCEGTHIVQVTDAEGNSIIDTVYVTASVETALVIQIDGDSLWVEGGSDWVWELDGFQVGAGQPYHIAWASGIYMVRYIDESGCLSGSAEMMVVLNVGLPEHGVSDMHAWPIPADHMLVIERSSSSTPAEMLDVNGRSVRSFLLRTGRNAIEVGDLVPGMYVIRCADGGVLRIVVG
ncbi:MAG TPA: SBBP repeat-containing protein [Flavobacteriales bacterium]|nr:SBBP repeat-containing protein [Flavobacteriales bacterium]